MRGGTISAVNLEILGLRACVSGHINKTFGTLAFCRRWLEEPSGGSKFLHGNKGQQKRYIGALKNLCDVRKRVLCFVGVDLVFSKWRMRAVM